MTIACLSASWSRALPSKWLYLVVIIDPGKDFFEEDHEVVDRTCLLTEYNDEDG